MFLKSFSDERPETSSDKSMKSGRSIDVYLPTSAMDESFQENEQSLLIPDSPQIPPRSVPGFPSSVESTLHNNDDDKVSPSLYSANFDSSRNFESTGEQDLPALSQSSSDRSVNPQQDLSKASHSSRSFSSERSKSSVESVRDSRSRPQPAARLHAGFSLPKPLMSTKSPVPLAVRRSSRPSLQIEVPSDIPETADRHEPQTPPTPKPRLIQVQQARSTKSSTSEFSSKDYSGRDYNKAQIMSEHEHSVGSYSEDFNSSDDSN